MHNIVNIYANGKIQIKALGPRFWCGKTHDSSEFHFHTSHRTRINLAEASFEFIPYVLFFAHIPE